MTVRAFNSSPIIEDVIERESNIDLSQSLAKTSEDEDKLYRVALNATHGGCTKGLL